ncbi:MAG: hypothetical protein M1831_000023 [Alyxoria varia]|nr:MAG: hypothetical protein M1831_000023 [Alyxoria varia]
MDQGSADPTAPQGNSTQQATSASSAANHQQNPDTTNVSSHDRGQQDPSSSEFRNKRKRDDSSASEEPDRRRPKFNETKARPPFNLLVALCKDGDILHYITTRLLHPRDLLLLYRTCRPFFYLVNRNMTKYIMGSAAAWVRLISDAPPGIRDSRYLDEVQGSSGQRRELRPSDDMLYGIFPFHIYAHLCVARSRTPGHVAYVAPPGAVTVGLPQPGRLGRYNFIPSLRYLFFILKRVNAIHSILRSLLYKHHFRLPETMPITLAKIWFLMDLPTNGGRIALVHNRNFFRDGDVRRAVLFFLKLDMVFSDPVLGSGPGGAHLRDLMLSQKGMFVLERVLKRTSAVNQMELMKLYIRWKFPSDVNLNRTGGQIFGVPEHECGLLYWEGWGQRWIPMQGGTVWVLIPAVAGPGAGGGAGAAPVNPQPIPQQQQHIQHLLQQLAQQQHTPASVQPQAPPLLPGPAPRRIPLMRPDQLAMREGIRRRLALNHEYRDMMISGYIDPDTLKKWSDVDDMARTDIIWQDELRRKQEKESQLEERAERLDRVARMMKKLLSDPSSEDEDQDEDDDGSLVGDSASVSDGDDDEEPEEDAAMPAAGGSLERNGGHVATYTPFEYEEDGDGDEDNEEDTDDE